MQKITPFLWFDKEAHKAAEFYVSVFGKDSKIQTVSKMENTPSGTVEIVTALLRGQEMTLMSAGPLFKFTEAISFVITCDDQAEVDYFWGALSAVPEAEQCGWLKDKFGVSWQVVPKGIQELTNTPGSMKAMMSMKKLDIAALKAAAGA